MNIEPKGISSAGQTSTGQTGQDIPFCSILPFFQYSLIHDLTQSIYVSTYNLEILFRQITMFIKVRVAFVFAPDPLINRFFSKIYQSKGLEPKNKHHKFFYKRYDLTKKYI